MEAEQTQRLLRHLDTIEQEVRSLRQLLGVSGQVGVGEGAATYYHPSSADTAIEGVFDGEKMIGYDGKTYQVSANYASKSKLVEGDPLKLYITGDGKFFYKQLGPVARTTVPAVLRSEGSHYVVDAEDGHSYNVLTASVTYYMSLYSVQAGDKVMIMIPADQPAKWAVIDNVL